MSVPIQKLAAQVVIAVLFLMADSAKCQIFGTYNGMQWNLQTNGSAYLPTNEIYVEIDGRGSEPGSYFSQIYGAVTIPSYIDGLSVTNPAYGVPVRLINGFGNFSGGTNPYLIGVTMPDTLQEILPWCFESCTSLSSIEIPGSVLYIDTEAFLDCTGLTSVTIGSGVLNIDDGAFFGCTTLQNIYIPSSVTNMQDGDTFFGCTGLKSINVDPQNSFYSGEGGVLFDKSKSTLIEVPGGFKGEYVIPSGVTRIGGGAFGSCTQLSSVIIPASVTNIGGGTFEGDTALTNICFEGNAPSFFSPLFEGCSSLTKINYVGGTTGWGDTFSEIPTAPCSTCVNSPAATATPMRVTPVQALAPFSTNINVPITPIANSNILSSRQIPLGKGVVADGVTPVLFMITGTAGTYSLDIGTVDVSSVEAVSYAGGSLDNNLYVLENNSWTHSTNITIQNGQGNTGTTYAYLQGMNWNSFTGVTAPSNQVNATITVSQNGQQVSSSTFGIRPVPIFLVHGIADTGATWGPAFLEALEQNVPPDFVVPITYGQGPGILPQHWNNATEGLPQCAIDASIQLDYAQADLGQYWDFVRYDAVGHSQGGVLLRMMCQTEGTNLQRAAFNLDAPVVSGNNFYRGRFRRVVTIGAPQNGSLIAYYIQQMSHSISPFDIALFNYLPMLVPATLKFNPTNQNGIAFINSPQAFPVDARIPFHCIGTTINTGYGLFQIYWCLGLQDVLLTGQNAGATRSQVLLPFGADGVVDSESAEGGYGTQSTELTSVSHCKPEWLFGVPVNNTQTSSGDVGMEVADLLAGPETSFGQFVFPQPISQNALNNYNALVPGIHSIFNAITQAPGSKDSSTNISYELNPPSNLPVEGSITWQAAVYDTNGIDTNGVSVEISTNDPALMTLSVSNDVIGQVVVYAEYMTTNGDLVFAAPVVVESIPTSPGATLTNIELQPPSVVLNVGDSATTSVWGKYSDGAECLLFLTSNQVTYSSSNPQTASVDTNGMVTLNAPGAAAISASFGGFSSLMEVTTAMPLSPNILSVGATNGAFAFSLVSSVGFTNIVEASDDLMNWVPVASLVPTSSITWFVDENAGKHSHRFYRIVVPAISTNLAAITIAH